MFNYPGVGGIFNYPRIFGNIVKSKCFARGCLKIVRKTSSENAGEDLPAAARCRPPLDPPTVGRPLRPSPPPTGGDDFHQAAASAAERFLLCWDPLLGVVLRPSGPPPPPPSVTRVTGFIKSASLERVELYLLRCQSMGTFLRQRFLY